MWNEMEKAINPFECHTRKERKAEIRDILNRQKTIYKDTKANGGTMTKPTLRRAKKYMNCACLICGMQTTFIKCVSIAYNIKIRALFIFQ